MALVAALVCVFVSTADARTVKQKKQAAAKQLEAADRLRDDLAGTAESERERHDYQKVIDAYRKVYYTAPSFAKADLAVLAVAALLEEQGRVLDDPKSFKDSIGQLAFLRREYPGSKHRVAALFTIGEIFQDDLNDRDQAKATFQDYLKHYPNSELAPDARQALANLRDGASSKTKSARSKRNAHTHKTGVKTAFADLWASKPSPAPPAPTPKAERTAKADSKPAKHVNDDKPATDEATAVPQPPLQQDASLTKAPPLQPGHMPRLTSIRHWSTPDYVRVAIDLEQEVKYDVGRVPKPDRIFFDLYGTKLSSELIGKSFPVEAGFLHRIRVAQYKTNMARVVLDVDDVAEYSAFLLPNPYRLIIDIHGKLPPAQIASKQPPSGAQPAGAKAQEAKPAPPKPDAQDSEPDVTITTIKKPATATQPAVTTTTSMSPARTQPKPCLLYTSPSPRDS